jgi:two-component system, NtrC family, response regulator AtoC
MLETSDEMLQRGRTGQSRMPASLALVACGSHGLRSARLKMNGEVVIGRHESCQLSLPDPTLSRYHARFTHGSDGVVVQDLGSRHGTWLDGKRVERAELGVGASVQLADVVVAVTLDIDGGARALPANRTLVQEALYLSPAMRDVRTLLHRVAESDLPVMICGETGTGKELAARELHGASPRSNGPLHVLNCGAIPRNLIESTLFGHERGAFTGAERARPSIFEEANGGTVFLDEVGELPLSAQAALLRVLESRRLTRVGSNREIDVDVRIISATHRDLHAMAARGEFRADILHRLCVIAIEIPPLRSRREEIAQLARHFLTQERKALEIDPRALSVLETYDWPGNVRELRNVMARAAVLAQGPCITQVELLSSLGPRQKDSLFYQAGPLSAASERFASSETLRMRLEAVEREAVFRALEQTGGNQKRAAQLLGIPLRTIERRLQTWRQAPGRQA